MWETMLKHALLVAIALASGFVVVGWLLMVWHHSNLTLYLCLLGAVRYLCLPMGNKPRIRHFFIAFSFSISIGATWLHPWHCIQMMLGIGLLLLFPMLQSLRFPHKLPKAVGDASGIAWWAVARMHHDLYNE